MMQQFFDKKFEKDSNIKLNTFTKDAPIKKCRRSWWLTKAQGYIRCVFVIVVYMYVCHIIWFVAWQTPFGGKIIGKIFNVTYWMRRHTFLKIPLERFNIIRFSPASPFIIDSYYYYMKFPTNFYIDWKFGKLLNNPSKLDLKAHH